jgi:hypothetical protein
MWDAVREWVLRELSIASCAKKIAIVGRNSFGPHSWQTTHTETAIEKASSDTQQ